MRDFTLNLIVRLRMGLLLQRAATTSSLTEEIEPLIRRSYEDLEFHELKRWLDIIQQEARDNGLQFCLHCSRPIAKLRGHLVHADTLSSTCESSSNTAVAAPESGVL